MTEDRIASQSDDRTRNNGVRHEYRVLTDGEKAVMVAVKDAGADLLARIDTVATLRGESMDIRQARIRVREAVMWAVSALTA